MFFDMDKTFPTADSVFDGSESTKTTKAVNQTTAKATAALPTDGQPEQTNQTEHTTENCDTMVKTTAIGDAKAARRALKQLSKKQFKARTKAGKPKDDGENESEDSLCLSEALSDIIREEYGDELAEGSKGMDAVSTIETIVARQSLEPSIGGDFVIVVVAVRPSLFPYLLHSFMNSFIR